MHSHIIIFSEKRFFLLLPSIRALTSDHDPRTTVMKIARSTEANFSLRSRTLSPQLYLCGYKVSIKA